VCSERTLDKGDREGSHAKERDVLDADNLSIELELDRWAIRVPVVSVNQTAWAHANPYVNTTDINRRILTRLEMGCSAILEVYDAAVMPVSIVRRFQSSVVTAISKTSSPPLCQVGVSSNRWHKVKAKIKR
jgi:hypothetical protein